MIHFIADCCHTTKTCRWCQLLSTSYSDVPIANILVPVTAGCRHVTKICCILPAPSNLSIIPAIADRRHVAKVYNLSIIPAVADYSRVIKTCCIYSYPVLSNPSIISTAASSSRPQTV